MSVYRRARRERYRFHLFFFIYSSSSSSMILFRRCFFPRAIFLLLLPFDTSKTKIRLVQRLLEFLLWSQVARVTTFTFTAVDCTWVKSGVASKRIARAHAESSFSLATEMLTCDRSPCHSCTSALTYEVSVQWYHRADLPKTRDGARAVRDGRDLTYVELNAVYFLSECCNRIKYGHLRRMPTVRTARGRMRAFTFELLAGEDQALLIRWNTLLVLDLGLDIFNGVRRLDLAKKFACA